MSRANKRWIGNGALLLFCCVPLLFWFFAGRMVLYRMEQRELATPAVAEVLEIESRTVSSRSSDGRTRTSEEFRFTVLVPVNGDHVRRIILRNSYETRYEWHTWDEVDPETYPVGSDLPVLVRADLGHRVAADLFFAAWGTPIILAGFGLFVSFFCAISVALMWEKAPRRPESGA